jgi:hypothetical protein
MRFFPYCRRAFLSRCAVFFAVAFLGSVNVFATPPEQLYGTWVAKDVEAKVGKVTIKMSFREEDGMKLVAWSELFFVGKVKDMKGPYKVRGDTISSKAIRGGTKAKFWFEGERLVLQFEDGKIVRFDRETEIR